MLKKQLILLLVTGLILVACNNNKSADEKTPDKSTEKETTEQKKESAKANETNSAISLTLTGGTMPGKYETVCKENCCSYGIAGDKVFGYQFSENGKSTRELSSVQLWVDDVTGNKTTGEFTVTVTFGELFGTNSTNYTIDTRNGSKKGSGNLELEYSNEKAKVHIKGTSEEGVGLDLTMECDKVFTMQNIGQ